MPLKEITRFLDAHEVRYVVISHSPAYTAQGIAALTHIPGKQMVKTVIVRAGDRFCMAVLPASQHVDMRALRELLGTAEVHIAKESEFQNLFPQCELGAMPPFGNLYGLAVYAEQSLLEDREIAFNAGTHRDLIRMSLEVYLTLVQPVIASFGSVNVGVLAEAGVH